MTGEWVYFRASMESFPPLHHHPVVGVVLRFIVQPGWWTFSRMKKRKECGGVWFLFIIPDPATPVPPTTTTFTSATHTLRGFRFNVWLGHSGPYWWGDTGAVVSTDDAEKKSETSQRRGFLGSSPFKGTKSTDQYPTRIRTSTESSSSRTKNSNLLFFVSWPARSCYISHLKLRSQPNASLLWKYKSCNRNTIKPLGSFLSRGRFLREAGRKWTLRQQNQAC